MIGTREDAALALSDFRMHRTGNVLSFYGSNRAVYLINGIVYKINNGEVDDDVNAIEYRNVNSIELDKGYKFPETSLYTVNGESVIAMEYIDGTAVAECYCTADEECDEQCAPDDIVSYFESLGLECGGYNAIINDEATWIIDAGC